MPRPLSVDRGERIAAPTSVYYLIGKGRPALERAMDSKVPFMVRVTRVARSFRLFLYLAPILLLTGLAVAFLFVYVGAFEQGYGWSVFFAIVGLLAASALVVPIVNMLITVTVPPRALPRLDFSDGIPADHRTMVVVPTLVSSRRRRRGSSGSSGDTLSRQS